MKCKKCGACCRVWGLYELTKADTARVPKHLWQKCHLYRGGGMMKPIGFACVAQMQDGRCDIYDRRPAVCRRFKPGSELCVMAREQDERPE